MTDVDELLSGVYSPTITEVSVLVREVRLKIGVLTDYVTVRIYYDGRSEEPYRFELSANVKTALARGDHDMGPAASEADALRKAVRMLTRDYEDAVRQGEMPDDSWLSGSD